MSKVYVALNVFVTIKMRQRTAKLMYGQINVQTNERKQICNTATSDNHWITGSRLGTGTYIQNVSGSNMLAGSQQSP